jgi:pimeloyl-ACP methyl ester carboxylesterase
MEAAAFPDARRFRESAMRVNGAELVVRDSGGPGAPLLLIHGSLAKDFLVPLAEALIATRRLRVVAYERRGYGRREHDPVDMAGQAADASEVLRQLGIVKAHVYGHSTGGSIALQLAHQSPDKVATLSLGEPDLPLAHLPSAAEHEAGLKELVESYSPESKKEVLAGVLTWLHGPDFMEVTPPGMFELAADDMAIYVMAEYPAYVKWRFGPEAVRGFEMPMQVIYGENTVKMSQESVDVLRQWNGRITGVRIPGATHFFPMTHRKETADAITSFCLRHA